MSTRAERLARIAQAKQVQDDRAGFRTRSNEHVARALAERQDSSYWAQFDPNATMGRASDTRKPRASHWHKRDRIDHHTIRTLPQRVRPTHDTSYGVRNVTMPPAVIDADWNALAAGNVMRVTHADGTTAIVPTPTRTRRTRRTTATHTTRDAGSTYSDRLARFGATGDSNH
jgi:hypothetical protein